DLALQLLHEGAQPPAALALFSPLVDPTLELAVELEKVRRDPMASVAVAQRLLDLYFGDADRGLPRLTFSFEDAAAFPPVLVQAGGRELLMADAQELARALTDAGGHCELEIWPGQMHVFQALARIVPEAEPALRRAADFIVTELAAAERRGDFRLLEGA
ncbi:alpha/beta hydrolase fold domain-containing protein, partial [Nocardioides stalactiti]|uniref:alpha/beta hydrolase fold domain-containing protein n=1 Tax=Nocardioides stalactiti TaxID=2755356 RepID=UPI0016021D45